MTGKDRIGTAASTIGIEQRLVHAIVVGVKRNNI
jgi:hypothetical protein